ncbi:DNRLRE domain-containing protein [Actinoplanes sp. NPDC051411]|uniref:DNRLRE domain-containing protein n=1 Tax=Actinoplanes sp. NPDC051411 TaxID=3155522 RepID=UPI00342BFC65
MRWPKRLAVTTTAAVLVIAASGQAGFAGPGTGDVRLPAHADWAMSLRSFVSGPATKRRSAPAAKATKFRWTPPKGHAAATPPVDPKAHRIGELTRMRTADESFYKLSDGRVQEAVSTRPVHYRDAKGAWQDISTAVTPVSHDGFSLGAEHNAFRSYFSGSAGALVRIEQGSTSIQVGADQARTGTPKVAGDTVTYAGALGGADLGYQVGDGGLKERIVLPAAPTAEPAYAFSLTLRGLTPKQRPDGSVALYGGESGRPAYVIPAPFMTDAHPDAGSPYGYRFSAKVGQAMTWDAKSGVLRLTVRPDAGWLRSPDRVFPVTVDPTVLVAPVPTQAANVMISSDGATTNYDTSWRLSVGTTTSGVSRALIRFPMPSVPAGTTVTSASLRLYYDQTHTTGSTTVPLEAHQATTAWDPTTATWNSANGITGALAGSTSKQAGVVGVWNTFPVTSAVQSWLNGTTTNNGFVIKAQNESTLGQGGPRYEGSLYAYSGETANYPQLLITYGVPGVAVDAPTVVHSTGAELSWPAYTNTTGNPANDLAEYQVHRSVFQSWTPSASTEVAPVNAATRAFVDSTAEPTPTSSPTPDGNAYYYMVAVKTVGGALIPGPSQLVRLPKAGLTTVLLRKGAATTLGSAQPATAFPTLTDSGVAQPWIEVGDNSSSLGKARAVVDFGALPATIGTNALVKEAHLKLWQEQTTTTSTGAVYELHALTRSFNAAQATWNSAATGTAWTAAGGDYTAAAAGTVSGLTNDPNRQNLDATGIVQGWVTTPASNHGLELKLANEATTGPQERTIFAGTDTAEPLLSPTLVVTYLDRTSENTYYAPTTPDKMVPGTTYTVPVTINNTTTTSWSASTEKLTYHWTKPDGTDATDAGDQLTTALPADMAPGAAATVNAQVTPPAPTDTNNKDGYTLSWDMKNTSTGAYLSAAGTGGVGSLPQATDVERNGSDQLGLESFYQYATTATGAGSALYSNASSGNTVWNYNAFSNPSRGFATFARMSYNSLDTTDSTTGFGWSVQLSTPTRLGTPLDFHPNPHPTEVTFTDGDGTSHVFAWNATASTWTAPPGVHLYLQQLADCGPQVTNARAWEMTRPDRTQFFYDCDGYPTSVVDRNGNESDFTYTVRKSQNKPTEFLAYITDASGRKTLTVDYYAKGDSYQYVDGTGNLATDTKLTDPDIIDHVKSIVDVSGHEIDFFYTVQGLLGRMVDGAGNAAAKTFGFAYDATQGMKNVKLVQVTDPRGNATKLSYYDPVTDPKVHWWTRTVTDRMGHATASLAYTEPGTVTGSAIQTAVTDAGGHVTTYQIDTAGRLLQAVNALGQKTSLSWDGDNNVSSITENNGARTTFGYDQLTGYPLSKKDAVADHDGTAAQTYAYQTSLGGHVADLTDKTSPSGRHWHFTYDTHGNLLTVQDPNGTKAGAGYTTKYAYDTTGQLLTITDANGHGTTYSGYDATGYPTVTKDALGNSSTTAYGPRGEVKSVTDPLGHTSTTNYDVFLRPLDTKVPKDQAGNVYVSTPAPVYDANDNMTQRTAPDGAASTATYDADDRATASTLPPDTATSAARTLTYTYDAVGQQLTVTSPNGNAAGAVAGAYTTTTAYDAVGDAVSVTDAAGNKTTTDYDDLGNATSVTDPLGHVTRTAYDLDHRPVTVTDPAGYTTSTAYDIDGLKTSATDQNGNTTLFGYDQDGHVVEQKVPHAGTTSNVTQYTYDQVGNKTAVISPRGVASGASGAFTTRTTYDADNRKSATFGAYDPNDTTYKTAPETDYTYDAAGRIAKVTAPPSSGSTVHPVTTYSYWDNGWTRSSTDPFGITTAYDYNALGKQTSRTITSAGGSSSRIQGWDYYPDGKLKGRSDKGVPAGLQVEMVDDSDTQNTAATGTWTSGAAATGFQGYDYRSHAAGSGTDAFTWNLTVPQDGTYQVYVQYPAVAGAATAAQYTVGHGGTTTPVTVDQSRNAGTWVPLGSFALTQNGTGQTISLAQNATGVVTADAVKIVRDNSADTQPTPEQFAYSYDLDGTMTDLRDTSPNARYDDYALAYDGLDRLTQMQEKLAGAVKHTTGFTYDAAGNTSGETHDGTASTYTFDARNALSQVVNKESAADPSPRTTRYTYTPAGKIATETKGNGNVVTTTYNLDNSLAGTVEKTSGGTLVAQHTYAYDPNGNETSDVSATQSADDHATTLDRTATHTYTPADQIATVTNSDGKNNQSYTYDLAGNVTSQTVAGTTTTNTYDRNRLLTASAGGAVAGYNYDPFGRTDTVTSGGTVQQRYTYDGFDHVATETKSGSTTSYTYDPFDRTVSQTTGTKTTTFDYLASSKALVAESTGGTVTKTYQYAPTGERLDQVVHGADGSETPTFYSYNAHTDVQAITDNSGNTKSTYGYTAYGSDDTSQDTGVDKGTAGGSAGGADPYNVYRFNADRIDPTTGNYDTGFRDYDPSSNRFLTRDMYEGALSDTAMSVDPYTGNRYAFGGGNPLSNIEIDGHFSVGGLIGSLEDAGKDIVKGAEDLLATAAENPEVVAEGALDYDPFTLPIGVFLGIVGHADSTAPNGNFSTPGDKPDLTKGLYITQDQKQEFQPVDTIYPKTREDCGAGAANWTYYMPLDSQGRAQGAMACLSKSGFNYTDDNGNMVKSGIPDTQIVGSRAGWPPGSDDFANSIPNGWRLGMSPTMDRGHLLGRQLGGSGTDVRNLTPLYSRVNRTEMKAYEDKIAGAIDGGATVYYAAWASYSGNNAIPSSITLEAYTSDGVPLVNTTIANVP